MIVKGAFSVHFTYTPNDSVSILLETDIKGIAAYTADETGGYLTLTVQVGTETISGNRYAKVSTLLDGSIVNTSNFLIGNSTVPDLNVWIYIHDTAISVYYNEKWVYTYVLAYSQYQAYATTADLKAVGGTVALTNIRREEIPDWRDAVYVDYEATGDNALQSIYQQRPVWMFPQTDRELAFTYHATKDTTPANHVWTYNDKIVNNNDISSDGLVYYYDIGISTYPLAAKEVGFITRLYRLSELDIGGVEAARTIQRVALEHRYPVESDMRLDPRPEISDRMLFDLVAVGTNTHIYDDVVIEDIQMSIQNGAYAMHITGRKNKYNG